MTAFTLQAQSCVCYQNSFLNDYKESDFIAQITVEKVISNQKAIDKDYVEFSTERNFKGTIASSLFIQQSTSNSKENSGCRLFLKPGDELILFAQFINEELITTPCKRNSFIYTNDAKFNEESNNLIGILNDLSAYDDEIEASSVLCESLQNDNQFLNSVSNLKLEEKKAHIALYNIKFTEDDKIESIGVVCGFNKEIDKEIRIMLIKKKWTSCNLRENNQLLVGYIYHPATTYRKDYLSNY